jgi:hypothetical protein
LIVNESDHLNPQWIHFQKPKGTFITKLSDSTSYASLQFLYKLAASYTTVQLYKPEEISFTYVIAHDYLGIPVSLENLKIPYYFKIKVDDINSILGQNQLEKILFKNI